MNSKLYLSAIAMVFLFQFFLPDYAYAQPNGTWGATPNYLDPNSEPTANATITESDIVGFFQDYKKPAVVGNGTGPSSLYTIRTATTTLRRNRNIVTSATALAAGSTGITGVVSEISYTNGVSYYKVSGLNACNQADAVTAGDYLVSTIKMENWLATMTDAQTPMYFVRVNGISINSFYGDGVESGTYKVSVGLVDITNNPSNTTINWITQGQTISPPSSGNNGAPSKAWYITDATTTAPSGFNKITDANFNMQYMAPGHTYELRVYLFDVSREYANSAGYKCSSNCGSSPNGGNNMGNFTSYQGASVASCDGTTSRTIGIDNLHIWGQQYSNSSLPIDLVKFVGKVDNCAASLNWSSGTESNFSHFEIQKSNDGRSFTAVGTQPGLGSNNNYAFSDKNFAGKAYYRLKMVDKDGSFKYSSVLSLAGSCSNITIAPTITNNLVNIKGLAGNETIQVLSMDGKLLYRSKAQGTNAQIATQNWPSGTYVVEVADQSGAVDRKRIIRL